MLSHEEDEDTARARRIGVIRDTLSLFSSALSSRNSLKCLSLPPVLLLLDSHRLPRSEDDEVDDATAALAAVEVALQGDFLLARLPSLTEEDDGDAAGF